MQDIIDREHFIQRLPMVAKLAYRAGFKRLDLAHRNALSLFHLPTFWADWGKKRLAQHLSTSEPAKPRQPPEVWTAFSRIVCPHNFRGFLRTALWRKLPVGSCLNSWLNNGGFCPFHQEIAMIPHVLSDCMFLGVASSFVNLVFPQALVCVHTRTEESLSHPAGLLVWTSIYAHWQLRCCIKKDTPNLPIPLNRFLHIWCTSLSDWTGSQSFSLRTPLVRGFQRGIDAFINRGQFTFSPEESLLTSGEQKRKQSATHDGLKPNWRTLLEEAVSKVLQFTSQGWRVVSTDGRQSWRKI